MSKELFVSSTPHETKVAVVEEDQLTEIYFERENEYTLAGSVYKGRVTRVLPGMQSAFVEIGLERDAFLYVTDFFEPQDEEGEEDFEAIAEDGGRSRRRYERPAPTVTEPAGEAEGREIETFSGGEADHHSVQHATPPANPIAHDTAGDGGDEESETPELNAGRHHDASSRDSSFRETLGRETLGRETSGRETSGEAPAEAERDSNDRRRFGRRRRGRRGRGFPESKFDSRNDSRNAARPPKAQPEEKTYGAAAGYQPIILPGESISKYRNRPATQTAHRAAGHIPAEPASAEAAPEESRRGTAGSDYKTQEYEAHDHETAEISIPILRAEATSEAAVSESVRPSAVVQEETQTREPEVDYEELSRRDTEEIDVAAILEKHRRESTEAHRPEARSSERRFGAMPGLVEEEEIEEEEIDQPSMLHVFEDEEYEDFEEEMLDRVEAAKPHDSAPDHQSAEPTATAETTEEEEEEEDEQETVASVEEAEIQASGSEGEAESEEYEETESGDGTQARAEIRGPSGYQPKVAFDRNNRRRRGGRRVRGGGHGGKRFPRAPLPQISDLLKEGQEILVQIAKEPIGKKGARITSHIALPGRFLVYMPTVNHNGVSRKIASEEERHRLKRIILSERQAVNGHQGGFIVRTAAAHASEEDLRADIRFLLNLWNEIKGRADSSKSPALIYHDLNLVERILRDQLSEGFSHIWVDSEQEYERIVRFVSRFQQQLVKRVKLYTKETPLFEQFNIQEEINKALKSKVWLKSGGYIVINQTEALVAIDVNTGKFVGKTQKLEDTIVKTNVDAIREIVRQIRLRDLGGIIVIDFIDMDERRNRQKVMQALEEALKSDRAPSKVLQFNDFGLVAITRKRVKQSLERTLGQPCTYCTGTGLIKSVTTVCNEIYVEMRKMTRHLDGKDVFVRVNPEVGKALKANNARWLQDMEELTGKTVIVKPDPTLHQEQFDIH